MNIVQYITSGILSYNLWIKSDANERIDDKVKGKKFAERAYIFQDIYNQRIEYLTEKKDKTNIRLIKASKYSLFIVVFLMIPDLALLLSMLIKGVIITSSLLDILLDTIIFMIWTSDIRRVIVMADKYPEGRLRSSAQMTWLIFWLIVINVVMMMSNYVTLYMNMIRQ